MGQLLQNAMFTTKWVCTCMNNSSFDNIATILNLKMSIFYSHLKKSICCL